LQPFDSDQCTYNEWLLGCAKWGERPPALIVLEPDFVGKNFVGKIGREDICKHVTSYADRGVIPRLAVPEHVKFVDDIPLTSVGKFDKKKLRATCQQQEAA